MQSMIGKGSFGTVYKVTNVFNSKIYTMEKIKTDDILHYEKTSIINELRILSSHKCPFIIKFKTCFYENEHIHLVTEYASKGDLDMLIKKNSLYNSVLKSILYGTIFCKLLLHFFIYTL